MRLVSQAVAGGRYELKGSELYAPPFGRGTITGDDVITMSDETRHTADFDWYDWNCRRVEEEKGP